GRIDAVNQTVAIVVDPVDRAPVVQHSSELIQLTRVDTRHAPGYVTQLQRPVDHDVQLRRGCVVREDPGEIRVIAGGDVEGHGQVRRKIATQVQNAGEPSAQFLLQRSGDLFGQNTLVEGFAGEAVVKALERAGL